MNIGKQYDPDNAFKAAARLHQSSYRAEVLEVGSYQYGNRLSKTDGQALLNYYEGLNSRAALRERHPTYSGSRDADMLRSEHIPFNLLAPLDTDRESAIHIIATAFGIECASIESIEMEYAPEPKEDYLDDGTAFDTYIKVSLPDGRSCGIGIEVKYTEQDYPIGKRESINVNDHDSLYWETARASGCFTDPDDAIFGSDSLRQIWRNNLLGLSMVARDEIDEFYSIILFPKGNTHFQDVLPEYISRLKDHSKSSVFGCTFEKFIAAIGGSPEFDQWREWLSRRYLVNA